jgi:recombination protein RecA
MTTSKDRAAALQARMVGNYGHRAAKVGFQAEEAGNVLPSGILSLDYTLGTGGYRRGHCVEVFGATTIGKTSIFGLGALRSAGAMGLVSAVIAVEPRWTDEWAEKHGVNLDTTVVMYPDHLEEAFEMLRDVVYNNEADFILFDSLGGGTTDKAIQSDKGTQAYGSAALITAGITRVIPRCYKDNITVMYINQVRDKGGGHVPIYHDSPGGHALHHQMMTRIQVKPGKDRYKYTIDGESVEVGKQVHAVLKKNNAAQTMGRTAKFDFYHIETPKYPFGLDVGKDVVTTAMLANVLEGSGWLKWRGFPGGKINGKEKAYEFFRENPDLIPEVRKDVLEVMNKRVEEIKAKAQLKVVEGGA